MHVFSTASSSHTRLLRSALAPVLAALLAGCSTLPSSGPTAHQVLRSERDEAGKLNLRIVEIDSAAVSALDAAPERTESRLAALAQPGRAVDGVGPGDVLQINIFEVGTGLFSSKGATAGEAFDPSAGNSGLGAVTVDRDGAITLPYIGRIEVAGRTPPEIQQMVARGLAGMSQSPQALVSVRQNVANTVVVMGDVPKPGRQPLTLAGDRLLDAIAAAGGTGQVSQNMVVRFTRSGQTVEQPLYTIVSDTPDDLLLLPGDRIELIRQPRSFTVFGATGRVSQVAFETSKLSLAEAIARAGGPSDATADPSAIFIFRYATTDGLPKAIQDAPHAAAAAGVVPAVAPGRVELPIIYRLNMLKPSSYFLAQRFAMRDKDVIYIANSASNQPTKLVQIVNLLFSPIFTVRAATR